MSNSNPDFSPSAKGLIAKAVKQVLGSPYDGNNIARPSNPAGGENFFWASLSNQVVTTGSYTYDFTEIVLPDKAVAGKRKTAGTSFGKVSTINSVACNMNSPALIRQDIGDGTTHFTIITEGTPFSGGLKKYMVLQMTSDATATQPGNYGFDYALIHS